MLFDGKEYTQLFLKTDTIWILQWMLKIWRIDCILWKGALENNLAENTIADTKYDYNTLLASSVDCETLTKRRPTFKVKQQKLDLSNRTKENYRNVFGRFDQISHK
jgi:hypothetical protein